VLVSHQFCLERVAGFQKKFPIGLEMLRRAVIEADPKDEAFELDASRHSVADQISQLAKTRTINAT